MCMTKSLCIMLYCREKQSHRKNKTMKGQAFCICKTLQRWKLHFDTIKLCYLSSEHDFLLFMLWNCLFRLNAVPCLKGNAFHLEMWGNILISEMNMLMHISANNLNIVPQNWVISLLFLPAGTKDLHRDYALVLSDHTDWNGHSPSVGMTCIP